MERAAACLGAVARRCVLRFDCETDERRFVEHLRPRVALCTALSHGLGAIASTAAFAWVVHVEARGPERSFNWDPGDARFGGLLAFGGVALAQVLVGILSVSAWLMERSPPLAWETWGIAAAVATAAACPWVNPQLVGALLGSEISETWAMTAGEAEAMTALVVMATAVGFCTHVPVRLMLWPIVPVSTCCSFALASVVAGSSRSRLAPLWLAGLLLFSALPLASLQRLERQERQMWLVAQDVAGAGKEEEEEGACSRDPVPDIVLRLADGGAVMGACSPVHSAIFGGRLEGQVFADLLPWSDRCRFQDLLAEVSRTSASGSLACSVNLPREPVRVRLLASDGEQDGARHLVGLRVLHEDRGACALDTEWSRVGSVPEHGLLDLPGGIEEELGSPRMRPGRSFRKNSDFGRLVSEDSVFSSISDAPWGRGRLVSEDSVFSAISDATWCRGASPKSQVTAAVQTERERADAAISTSVVMEEASFRCLACSRPRPAPHAPSPSRRRSQGSAGSSAPAPELPAPELRRAQTACDLRLFILPTFNGDWEAVVADGVAPNDWLRRLRIADGRATLGDGAVVPLVQLGDRGPVLLCGGQISLRGGRRLVRCGRSGAQVEFVLVNCSLE